MKVIMLALAVFASACQLAHAEEIAVDKSKWEKLSPADQTQIQDILKKNDLLGASGKISPIDPSNKGIFTGICKAACDAAFVTASAGCTGLSGGAAVALCIAAAAIGRDQCKDHC